MITKSLYLIGAQCPYWLWKASNEKDTLPELDDFTKGLFESGYEVEQLANTLFKKESQQIKLKHEDCEAVIDILENKQLIEIKSSASVKEIHYEDLAFQIYLCQKNNIEVESCHVLLLNNKYIKQGDINTDELFKKVDVTQEVLSYVSHVERNIKVLKEIIADKCPDPIHQCKPAYSCPAHQAYINSFPLGNVFELSRGKSKGYKLAKQGITNIKDIPNHVKLTDKQNLQRKCAKTGKAHVDKEKINIFLQTLKFPIYYLDFETVNFPIPKWDGTRPYQQICVQHSCHIEQEDGTIEHKEFLVESTVNPIIPFIEDLKNTLGEKGSIVVYNQGFEATRLKEIARDYPQYEEWVQSIQARFIDLLTPFRDFAHYDQSQKGSASIKRVLPTLTDLDYSQLEINNGALATTALAKLCDEENEEQRTHLLKYCELDTKAEVEIVKNLRLLTKCNQN